MSHHQCAIPLPGGGTGGARMTRSLLFQFFLGNGGISEGFELLVEVSPTKDRNAGETYQQYLLSMLKEWVVQC